MGKLLPAIGFFVVAALLGFGFDAIAPEPGSTASDSTADTFTDAQVAAQNERLNAASAAVVAATIPQAGPQAPRDIESTEGTNPVSFDFAPAFTSMNLCDIHFHESAEHRGGEFTTFAGNGDGNGYGTGFLYNGTLTEAELADYGETVGATGETLIPGDTIEIHYVHTSADVPPGPGLGSCLADGGVENQPILQVQAQVYVLVNDRDAADLVELTTISNDSGFHQANIPSGLGDVVSYLGSTTGPGWNETPSPLMVSWQVHPSVLKVDIASVQAWFEDNVFNEDHGHAVRNLVTNPDHLSPIS